VGTGTTRERFIGDSFECVSEVATAELPKCKLAEHLKNVFSLHFFENLFLGALLVFLSQFSQKEKTKLEHSFFGTLPSETKCFPTTSIGRQQHRLSCCMHVQSRYVLGIRETLAALVVWRVQKNAFLRRSRFVSCVRTQVHMTVCLFVLICLHVTCTNKNLGNERVTTFLTHASSWSVRTFLKQDGVSNDPETFSYVMKIWKCVRAHETQPNNLTKGLTGEPMDLPFQGRRCTWRSWAYLKLQCLCSRLRIGVVKTHSDVNPWPSRPPSSEHPLLPWFPRPFLENVRRRMEMTLPHTLSLESTKNYSSLNTKNYSSLYLPPLVIQSGGSNLGCSASCTFSL